MPYRLSERNPLQARPAAANSSFGLKADLQRHAAYDPVARRFI